MEGQGTCGWRGSTSVPYGAVRDGAVIWTANPARAGPLVYLGPLAGEGDPITHARPILLDPRCRRATTSRAVDPWSRRRAEERTGGISLAATSMKQLLEAGVHFGHQTRRWNPKMREYIFAERNGIHIIDLAQTVSRLEQALEFVRETVRRGDSVLFVGTKKQAQDALAEAAQRSGQHFVNTRWLGGMLTNFTTIKRPIQRLEALEARRHGGDGEAP